MLFVQSQLFVFAHLLDKLLLVIEESVSPVAHALALLVFIHLLALNDLQVEVAVGALLLLQATVVVGELLLTGLVQLCQVLLQLFAFGFRLSSQFKFPRLERLLGPDLIKLCLSVIGSLLELPKSLDFFFFLLFDALIFPSLGFLSSLLLSVELSNFCINAFLGLAGSLFRGKSILVGNFDLLIHDPNALALGLLSCFVLLAHLLDVGKHDLLLSL